MHKFRGYAFAGTGVIGTCLILMVAGAVINSSRAGAQNTPAPTQIRNIDTPALQPFQAFACGTYGSESLATQYGNRPFDTWKTDIAFVPPGRRLVIEFITTRANLRPDFGGGNQKPRIDLISIATRVGEAQGEHVLQPIDQSGELIPDRVVLSQQVKGLYANPGTRVTLFARANGQVDERSTVCFSISGYLIDLTPFDGEVFQPPSPTP